MSKIAKGAIGIIEIPSIRAKYDLYYKGARVDEHQHNALLYKRQGCLHIGNHHGSMSLDGGQWKIQNIKVGDKAHLEYVTGNGCEVVEHIGDYVCYAVMLCDVDDDMNLYYSGQEVKGYRPTDLICVCCVGKDNTRNYAAFFERVD